jgi:hypothetical protein
MASSLYSQHRRTIILQESNRNCVHHGPRRVFAFISELIIPFRPRSCQNLVLPFSSSFLSQFFLHGVLLALSKRTSSLPQMQRIFCWLGSAACSGSVLAPAVFMNSCYSMHTQRPCIATMVDGARFVWTGGKWDSAFAKSHWDSRLFLRMG